MSNDFLNNKNPTISKGVHIICSAIYFKNETIYDHQPKNIKCGLVITGRRHHNVFQTIEALGQDFKKLGPYPYIQGFITSDDRFLDRKEAGRVAYEAHQIENETDCLFSQDLY